MRPSLECVLETIFLEQSNGYHPGIGVPVDLRFQGFTKKPEGNKRCVRVFVFLRVHPGSPAFRLPLRLWYPP